MKNVIIPEAEPFFLQAGPTGCLLVHGFTGTPREMRLMGDFLQKNGVTVYGVRLAGHGTDIKDMTRTRWRDWVASVEDGLHTLQGSCDCVFIAGLSMGGVLSLLAASYMPLQGAIAMSAPYEIKTDWRISFAKPLSYVVPVVHKETHDDGLEENHIDYPGYPTRSIAELIDLIKQTRTQLDNINIPTLMIHSRSDKTVPEHHQHLYAELLKDKDLETVMLEKSGHVMTEDVECDIVFKKALTFIQEHS